jgi:hypothetical protein
MPTTEPAPVKLDGIWVTANLKVKSLTYGDVRVAPLTCTAQVKDNVITVKPLDLNLNGSPMPSAALADVGIAGYRYQLRSGFEKLDLAPFISTFAPTLTQQITGSIKSFKIDFSGQGVTPPNLSCNAAGES